MERDHNFRGGPKYLNEISRTADESKVLVNIVCQRIVKPCFERGEIMGRVQSHEKLCADLNQRLSDLLTPFEIAEIEQRLHSWQDEIDVQMDRTNRTLLQKIMERLKKIPTLERVNALLGEEMADLYSEALTKIEEYPDIFSLMPSEKTICSWNKQQIERVVSLIIDVVAPHGTDMDGMAAAYAKYLEEYRAQARERQATENASKDARREAAKALGIWLPIAGDLIKWETDPRTASRAARLQRLTNKVIEKMRIMRSVLQFIPRRKFSNHTIQDMDANMARMERYLCDMNNRVLAKQKLGKI